ncbi:uncharacterized protein LOC126298429 [Schistocerca gregaria]|uniref:uncharacterized protein LOC126298429 n=1 Tax=Schistocerca gregaria TaxID=7010 RepID=UPI00211DC73C|nr:uncharacterized protein LOC126298429 [Schistocerca gregaria]
MRSSTIIGILVCVSGAVFSMSIPRRERLWHKFATYKYPHLSSMSPWDGPSGREPTCEELRAMWRFSKRQSRITELTNEVPMYKDPFAYNVWEPYGQTRSLGNDILDTRGRDYVYGTVVHYPQHRQPSEARQKYSPYDEVVRLLHRSPYMSPSPVYASAHLPSPRYSSFEELKNIIRAERAQEQQQQQQQQEQQQQMPVRSQIVGSDSDYYISEDSEFPNDEYRISSYESSGNAQNIMPPMIYGVPNEAMYSDSLPPKMYRAEDPFLMGSQTNHMYNDRSQEYIDEE